MDAMKTRLLVGAGLLSVAAIGFAIAANFFADQTWNVIRSAEEGLEGAFVRSAPAPLPKLAVAVPYLDAEGYAVISAWKQHWSKQSILFVGEEMRPEAHLEAGKIDAACLPDTLRLLYRPALQDLASIWGNRYQLLPERFANPNEFVVEPTSDFSSADPRLGIPEHALGYFVFSPVGFNRAGSLAALYVMQRDGRFAWGEIFLMHKDRAGKWEVEGNGNCGWIT